jgi:hypothetical protein
MKRIIGKFMRANPALTRPLWRHVFPLTHRPARHAGDDYADRASAFTTIYRENRWQSDESVSGTGSTERATRMLQTALPALLKKNYASTFLDAPCGDFNWMARLDLRGIDYIGGDIVPDLIDDLNKKFGRTDRTFEILDIVDDPLPAADIWLCRHVLFHLSQADIFKVLENFARSEIRYILIDNVDFITNGTDIRSGGFRLVNLRSAPFNLPKPIDRLPNSNPPDPPDYLNLWTREQVATALATAAH